LVGKLEEKGMLGRAMHKWENNIRINVREVVWECLDWIHLAQDRDQWLVLVNVIMNPQIP
jgi:hypothetical protein